MGKPIHRKKIIISAFTVPEKAQKQCLLKDVESSRILLPPPAELVGQPHVGPK